MRIPACAAVAALMWTMAAPARATEPLPDRIWYHSRAGIVFQPGKSAIVLPTSDKLRAMMAAESCSAAGGPRGVYRYMSGKVWLVGLHRCGGGIGLRDVYPGMLTPPVADWLNGVVVARLGKVLCISAAGVPIPEIEVHFIVENGVVNSLEEKAGDLHTCTLKSPQ